MDALCLLLSSNSTCCPNGYICTRDGSEQMLSSDSSDRYTCQPANIPIVPPQLNNPVFNRTLVIPPLPMPVAALVGPNRGATH